MRDLCSVSKASELARFRASSLFVGSGDLNEHSSLIAKAPAMIRILLELLWVSGQKSPQGSLFLIFHNESAFH